MSDDLILGVDGGGTKMILALADKNGCILRTALGGGINPMGNPGWRTELEKYIEPFRSEKKLAGVAAALPVYGEVAHLSRLLEETIRQAFPKAQTRVLNDVDAAHLGALAGKPGILVLSGTGSMAWARNADGTPARTGGWGDVIGDEGSSYWVGRRALNLVSQSLDGRFFPTALTEAIFAYLQLDPGDPMDSLGGWATSSATRSSIAALSAVVDRAAREGDQAAIGLFELAADELAKHYRAVAGHCEPEADWTYAGGTFRSSTLLKALEHRIGRPAAAPRLSPIGGALLAAARLLDWPIDDGWIGHVAASSQAAFAQ
ncbi:N-acetylglucosamine kinase-like BadF-type ATPase [Rhizobium leguminosarum]|uniref:N-acetylglucosamine kinase n=1 Tax=Rhizobium leguminosarum TaxID=384 RepID=UPI001616E84F|nr:BadF/BadG/BcrA/BcrD ATPase family protein [Rhizobium leguminosarum]MBB5663678.1 N-acetylglucosamine kinase-like BadF-type ATPase [Rhizobium leguminosarum]